MSAIEDSKNAALRLITTLTQHGITFTPESMVERDTITPTTPLEKSIFDLLDNGLFSGYIKHIKGNLCGGTPHWKMLFEIGDWSNLDDGFDFLALSEDKDENMLLAILDCLHADYTIDRINIDGDKVYVDGELTFLIHTITFEKINNPYRERIEKAISGTFFGDIGRSMSRMKKMESLPFVNCEVYQADGFDFSGVHPRSYTIKSFIHSLRGSIKLHTEDTVSLSIAEKAMASYLGLNDLHQLKALEKNSKSFMPIPVFNDFSFKSMFGSTSNRGEDNARLLFKNTLFVNNVPDGIYLFFSMLNKTPIKNKPVIFDQGGYNMKGNSVINDNNESELYETPEIDFKLNIYTKWSLNLFTLSYESERSQNQEFLKQTGREFAAM